MKRLLLLAFVLANIKVSATGVCLTCPTGYDCVGGTPVSDSNAKQVLVREGGKAVWKDVSAVTTLRGPQGPTGAAGPAGPQGAKGVHPCVTAGVTVVKVEGICVPNTNLSINCRLIGNLGTCITDWFRIGALNGGLCSDSSNIAHVKSSCVSHIEAFGSPSWLATYPWTGSPY